MTNPSAFLDDIKKELKADRFQRRQGGTAVAASLPMPVKPVSTSVRSNR